MPAIIGTSVETARKLLAQGSLVAIPTETVYGLGGNALDVKDIPLHAASLASKFWPGPLTLLLPKEETIPDLVTAGSGRVALRCPAHAMTLQLLKELDFPLAAPSANPFNYVSPTTAKHVMDQLGEKIEYILDGGPCTVGIESTIIGWNDNQPVIHRLGAVPVESIESEIGPVRMVQQGGSTPEAPGQLLSHYAPRKRFLLGDIDQLIREHGLRRPGVLRFQSHPITPAEVQKVLSPSGDLREAARNLFGMLRELDQENVDAVVAEEVPDTGIGRAINDRLRRAAAR